MTNNLTYILTVIGDDLTVKEVIDTISSNSRFNTANINKPNSIKFWACDDLSNQTMISISRRFLDVTLMVNYADEDLGVNVGSYTLLNGIMVKENRPTPLSIEAYEMSMAITNDYYYVDEFLETFSEDEAAEKFPSMCIRIAYNMRRFNDNTPHFILKKLIDLAVSDEEYEFANELTKVLKK
jgi:hypothetical protein